MSQQQLGAFALIACGVGIVVGFLVAKAQGRIRSDEPLPLRVLVTLATFGLAAGLVLIGLYLSVPALSSVKLLMQVALGCFAVTVVGYAASVIPSAWRAFWGA